MKRSLRLILSCIMAVGMAGALCACASQSYTPPAKTAVVDTPAIGEKKTLRVGVDAQNPPFAASVSGKIVGLDVDIAAALADEMGLDLKVVDVGSDPEGSLSKGDVDIVMGLDKTSTSFACWLSDPYVQTAVALFAPAATTAIPTPEASPLIAAQTSSMSAWEVNNQFGEASLVSSPDLKAAFASVETGAAAYVAADAVIGSYVAHSNAIDMHIVALMKQVSGYSIGVTKTNTALSTAIGTALATLSSNGTIAVIESKWLGSSLDLTAIALTEGSKQSTPETTPAAAAETQTAPAAAAVPEATPAAAGANAVTPTAA
ncbi:MAG: transporter substrate-binding domain-containing protein [Eggerthellaceae bacterium]